MRFRLVFPEASLYISEERVAKEPIFLSTVYTPMKGEYKGWYRDEMNETYYRWDSLVSRIFCVRFSKGRSQPEVILSEENSIKFYCNQTKKTIY